MASSSCRHLMGVFIMPPDIILAVLHWMLSRESVSNSVHLQYMVFPYSRDGRMNDSYIVV